MTFATYSEDRNQLEPKILFKTVSDIVKCVDQKRRDAGSVSDLFANNVEYQRVKLRTCVENLMLSAPNEYGKRCEEILWKKCFHDVYVSIKQLRKNYQGTEWCDEDTVYLQYTLNNGIGYYHYLIMKLKDFYDLDFMPLCTIPSFTSEYGLAKTQTGKLENKPKRSENGAEWAKDAVYRCLSYIGDLNRYMLDVYPGWDFGVASYYYWQALIWDPNIGTAFNQLGSLALAQNNVVNATYYYMRSTMCLKPFMESERNLMILFEKYSTMVISSESDAPKAMIVRFLQLADSWYFQNRSQRDTLQIAYQFSEAVAQYYVSGANEPVKAILQPNSLRDLVFKKETVLIDQIFPDTVFKILLTLFVCHAKLSKKGTNLLPSATSVISHFVGLMLDALLIKMRLLLPSPKQPPKKGAKNLRRFRRRRRGGRGSPALDSDEECDSLGSDTDGSSEEELIFDEVCDQEHSSKVRANDVIKSSKEMQHKTLLNSLVQLLDEHYCILQAIEVSCDWIQANPNVMTENSTWNLYIENFVLFLNYLYPLYNEVEIIDDTDQFILPEDIHCRGMPCLGSIRNESRFDYHRITNQNILEQTKMRTRRFVKFGEFLSHQIDPKVDFDSERKWFRFVSGDFISSKKEVQNKEDASEDKQKLMAQLWMEEGSKIPSEKGSPDSKAASTYLILDYDAVTQYLFIVKKLIHSGNFVIILPTGVVSIMDQLKSTDQLARNATHWVEAQYRRGNQSIRNQRKEEQLSIPGIKTGKHLDEDSMNLIRQLECCYFFKEFDEIEEKPETYIDCAKEVYYLTGNRLICNPTTKEGNKKFSRFITSARNVGIDVKHISDFHSELKNARGTR